MTHAAALSAALLKQARLDGRDVLLEHEVLDLLDAHGLRTPTRRFVPVAELHAPLLDFAPARAVMKVVSPKILHKSDVGGVVFLSPFDPRVAGAAAEAMLSQLPQDLRPDVLGVLFVEAVDFESGLGNELLVGLRNSDDFGPVMTVGFGGTGVEALAMATQRDQSTVLFSPTLTPEDRRDARLNDALFFRWASGGVRGVKGLTTPDHLRTELTRLTDTLDAIRADIEAAGGGVAELELNPVVWAGGALVPLDGLLRLAPAPTSPTVLPLANLKAGLRPKTAAVIGVSTRMNMGRIIVRAVLAAGFNAKKLWIVRPEVDELDGVVCVPNVAALPECVDLLVVAIGAEGVPALLEDVIAHKKARSVLLIPGGMGETEAGQVIADAIDAQLEAAGPDRPVLLGNNSLGLVSRAAQFDAFFIPESRLLRVREGLEGVAVVSQSGAFMITQLPRLDFLALEYQVSLGNQMDARFSDVVEAFLDDDAVRTLGLYIEGFKPNDGARLCGQIKAAIASGRQVVVYKGGRSAMGQAATAGHTASVAGDHRITRDLLGDAGAMVAESFDAFRGLLTLAATLRDKTVRGGRVAFMSNAGYEAVGMADGHGELTPATLSADTKAVLSEIVTAHRLDRLVSVANPLDLTPMANDLAHGALAEALLTAPEVDVAIFGNVPLSPNVKTLPADVDPKSALDGPEAYATQMIRLAATYETPFVVVIDGERRYQPLIDHLRAAGLPVFQDADRAARLLSTYISHRITNQLR